MEGAQARRSIDLDEPVDLRRTLRPLCRGRGDPTSRIAADGFWRATRTPEGPATLHVSAGDSPTSLSAEAWGPGAGWAIGTAPALVGALDDVSGFAPEHPLLVRLRRDFRGLRICRTASVMEALVPTILEQKVTGLEAKRAFAGLVRAHGEPAPGPAPLVLPPSSDRLADLPYWAYHPFGIEQRRAETVRRACRRATELEATSTMPSDTGQQRLRRVAGIGAWTAAEVALVAYGDPDAVSVGDFHLPHQVAYALAGERRADDARMLELLEPYRGHRGRVIRLIEAAGIGPPRRGPRYAPRSIARI